MKGPKSRLTSPVRRYWHCRACGRNTWTPGHVVHLTCTCSHQEMNLVESQKLTQRRDASRTVLPAATEADAVPNPDT